MNLIEHISADNLMPCAIFSLEMSKQQLAQRMLCSRGQIDAHKLRKGIKTIIVPHPKKDLPTGTARAIAKQAGWI